MLTSFQLLKSHGEKQNPREVAEKVKTTLGDHPIIEKLEVAGPGFINITVSCGYILKCLRQLVLHGVQPPRLSGRKRVVVDFSSPNVAKEMHVGHLRYGPVWLFFILPNKRIF